MTYDPRSPEAQYREAMGCIETLLRWPLTDIAYDARAITKFALLIMAIEALT